jgi:hypothetical protein
MVKRYSPTRGFAACGGIMFHHACYTNMGKFECTSPDSLGILNFFIPGFAGHEEIFNPCFLK